MLVKLDHFPIFGVKNMFELPPKPVFVFVRYDDPALKNWFFSCHFSTIETKHFHPTWTNAPRNRRLLWQPATFGKRWCENLDVPGRWKLGYQWLGSVGFSNPKEYPIKESRWNNPTNYQTLLILTSVPGHPSTGTSNNSFPQISCIWWPFMSTGFRCFLRKLKAGTALLVCFYIWMLYIYLSSLSLSLYTYILLHEKNLGPRKTPPEPRKRPNSTKTDAHHGTGHEVTITLRLAEIHPIETIIGVVGDVRMNQVLRKDPSEPRKNPAGQIS